MHNKQLKAFLELFFGVYMGIPSDWNLFLIIFNSILKEGNKFALIGISIAIFIGLITILDSIARLLGFKHLGELIKHSF